VANVSEQHLDDGLGFVNFVFVKGSSEFVELHIYDEPAEHSLHEFNLSQLFEPPFQSAAGQDLFPSQLQLQSVVAELAFLTLQDCFGFQLMDQTCSGVHPQSFVSLAQLICPIASVNGNWFCQGATNNPAPNASNLLLPQNLVLHLNFNPGSEIATNCDIQIDWQAFFCQPR
jgi:hypothetical protein